jgi:hypothetical protein
MLQPASSFTGLLDSSNAGKTPNISEPHFTNFVASLSAGIRDNQKLAKMNQNGMVHN